MDVLDPTDVDFCKVMAHLQKQDMGEQMDQKDLENELKDFDSIREVLEKSKKLVEPIQEEQTEFDPSKHQFFIPPQELKYRDVEWKHIQFTSLGRRLTQHFDNLKMEKKLLSNQLKKLKKNQQLEIENQIHQTKDSLKKTY